MLYKPRNFHALDYWFIHVIHRIGSKCTKVLDQAAHPLETTIWKSVIRFLSKLDGTCLQKLKVKLVLQVKLFLKPNSGPWQHLLQNYIFQYTSWKVSSWSMELLTHIFKSKYAFIFSWGAGFFMSCHSSSCTKRKKTYNIWSFLSLCTPFSFVLTRLESLFLYGQGFSFEEGAARKPLSYSTMRSECRLVMLDVDHHSEFLSKMLTSKHELLCDQRLGPGVPIPISKRNGEIRTRIKRQQSGRQKRFSNYIGSINPANYTFFDLQGSCLF